MDLLRSAGFSFRSTFDLHVMEILGIRFNPLILRLCAELLRKHEEENLSRREVESGESFHGFRPA